MINYSELEKNANKEGIGRCVVATVITDKNKILIVKRKADDFMGGLWELPSGKVDFGESIDSALLREVKEETNLDIESIEQYIASFDYLSKKYGKMRQFNFIVKVKKGKVVLTEHDELAWISKSEIEDYNLTKETRNIISSI